VHNKRKDKFDHASIKIIFLGYPSNKKRYKCYDPINRKKNISRDIIFFLNEAYFKDKEETINFYIIDNQITTLPQLTLLP
jgi:hypothetical protein